MQLCSHNAHADVNYIYISRSVTIPAHTPPRVTAFHGKAHSLLWPHPGLGNQQACLPTQLGSRWNYSHWETGPAPPLLFSPFTSNKTHFKKKEKEGRGSEASRDKEKHPLWPLPSPLPPLLHRPQPGASQGQMLLEFSVEMAQEGLFQDLTPSVGVSVPPYSPGPGAPDAPH